MFLWREVSPYNEQWTASDSYLFLQYAWRQEQRSSRKRGYVKCWRGQIGESIMQGSGILQVRESCTVFRLWTTFWYCSPLRKCSVHWVAMADHRNDGYPENDHPIANLKGVKSEWQVKFSLPVQVPSFAQLARVDSSRSSVTVVESIPPTFFKYILNK